MFGYIYKTTNLVNNKIYIGQHKRDKFDANYYGSGKLITNAIYKYGKENFKVELIDTAETLEELTTKEYYYIKLYKSSNIYGNYNLLRDNDKGIFKHDEESKKQISKSIKRNYDTGKMVGYWTNKKLPQHMIDNLDVSNKRWYTNGKQTLYITIGDPIPEGFYPGRHGHFGHPMSEEARQKLRNKALGRKVSEETKQKISKANTGKIYNLTDEQRLRRSANAHKRNENRHWFTNGIINTFTYECPENYRPGYTRHKK